MLVMALGMMCAGELMLLSAQDSTGSATQQTQPPNDTSKEQASTQTPQDPVTQQTQPSNDTMQVEMTPNGIRILGGIRLRSYNQRSAHSLTLLLGSLVLLLHPLVLLLRFLSLDDPKPLWN